jgi:fatty-acyl-CoA synthase
MNATTRPASDPPRGTAHIGTILQRTAARAGDREAIVFPDDRLGYAELYSRALDHAASLRAMGLSPGDHVGLLLTNRPEFAELLLGAAIAGCVTVLINARYKAHELRHVITDADVRALICSRDGAGAGYDFPALLQDAFPALCAGTLPVPEAPRLRRIFVLGDVAPGASPAFAPLAELREAGGREGADAIEAELPRRRADEPLLMLYTSGTTSAPKGCLLSHVNVVGKGIAFAELFGLGAGDRIWNPLPVFHVGFVMPLASALAVGATVVTLRHFDPSHAREQLVAERITHAFPAFVQMWQGVVEHPEFDAARLPHLRCGLAVGPADLLTRLQRATPDCPFISCYGMTEGTSVFTAPRPSDAEPLRLGCEGRPFGGLELRIVRADSGEPCAPGDSGEIQIRGYSVANSYYNASERTAEAFLPGGWFATGDLGSVDPDGNLTFRGRAKDMLKVGGENVAALEIESYLTRHPDVAMAQVVGVTDERLSEVPAAFVELRPGSTVTPRELVAYCQGQIASFKVPRHVVIVDEWPMSATKIQKQALSRLPLGPRLL